jgi:hypothetical protein
MKHLSYMPVIARPQAVAIDDFQLHGLPRDARSDGNNLVIARNVVTRQSMCGIGRKSDNSQ